MLRSEGRLTFPLGEGVSWLQVPVRSPTNSRNEEVISHGP